MRFMVIKSSFCLLILMQRSGNFFVELLTWSILLLICLSQWNVHRELHLILEHELYYRKLCIDIIDSWEILLFLPSVYHKVNCNIGRNLYLRLICLLVY